MTFVAAGLAGRDGRVVGVDRSPEAVARARFRAGQRGLAQVKFVDTFVPRLRAELQENAAVFAHPMLLSAWAATEPA